MFVRIHNSYRLVVAIADSDLVGKVFYEGKFQLDVKENFYKGEEKSEDELLKIMEDMVREDATFNIVGENSIRVALEARIICEEGIKKIQGIPFALVLL